MAASQPLEVLRQAWAQVLGEDESAIKDDDVFFDLGGDSLKAAELIDNAEERGLIFTIRDLFMNPSLESLASCISSDSSVGTEYDDDDSENYEASTQEEVPQKTLQALSTRYNLNVCDIESVYPCSPIQTSLIVDIDGRANQYMKQLVFRLADDVHLEHFKAAWDETVRANPVLRTRICRLENTLGNVQVVVRDGLTWHTAHAKPLTQFLEADANTALGVDGGPAFRYAIVASADHDGDIRRYFIWTVHHALCDGASIEMILAEAAARFRGKPVLPRQPFESFIRSAALTPDPAQERVFWRETLSRTSPTPYPRVRQSSAFRADPSSRLSQTLTLDGHPPGGVTRALLLRATWAVLMAHYNGTEEVCFGVINSGRTAAVPGVSTMSGPTVNLVPITLHIDGQETVASFLSRVRTQAAEMIPFEHSGIANIRKYVADSPATALDFQTLMVVHPATFSKAIAPALDDLGLQYLGDMGKSEQHPYPLIISLTLASNTVDLSLQYDSQVIETQQAQRVIFHFQTVLDQLSKASEDALMRSITLLSDNDIAQIAEWNRYTPPAENTCVDWLFQAQVAKQPNATAVCSLEKSLTYHEVDEKSSSLALQLVRDQGVHPGDFVAVCFGKSIWTVVAILAVFKAGGTYVPIDPAHPMGRIREIVDTACIKVALASQDGASVLNTICPRIIIVGPSLRSCPTEGFHSRSNPQNLAYLLFTSGSTGKPKGILISHSAICTSIKYHGKAFGAGPHWRTFQFCAHTFDISIGEFLTTLAYGGCICVPTDHDRLNNLAGSITALNANTLLVVPTVAKLLHPSDVPTLKTLVLGGEPVTSEIITRWADHVELTCSYGPSETAVWSAANLRVTTAANPAHIGGNIGGTMWIVNLENYHELCAIGCVGELVVSGSILGNGYFNDPATTDAAFVAAPRWLRDISPSYTSGDRIYKTGDLARYNPDGTFHIVGRRDTQVKLRGFRIELGEIENQCIASGAVTAALADLPDSGPCKGQIVVVVSLANPELGVQDGEGGFVLANGRFSNMEQLKAHLRYVLPEYMVPTVLVVLNRFPHLISGKVDRKAVKNWIRAMDIDTYTGLVQGTTDNATDAGDIVPGSLADRLRVLWSGVLHTPAERIGKRTSFFSLGGDSLAAIEVVSRAKAIGLPVTVRGIISANTLGNLVAILENSDATATVANTTKAPRQQWIYDLSEPDKRNLQMRIKGKSSGTVKDAYPLAPIQRDMSNAREVEPTVFVLSWKMHILPLDSQPVSLDKLAVAWKRVVSRYPILRTVFLPPSGTIPALQVVLEDIVPEVIVISVSAHDPEPSFHLVGAQDIDHGPLPHRALFYRHGDKYHGVIELDHRIIDGWSLGLIRAAFLEAYNDANIICLNEAPPPYKNFVAALHPSRVEADKRHWSAVLRGAQPSILAPLPHKITPSHSQGSQLLPDGKTVLHLPDLKSQALLAFCANNGTTVASVVDAAWAQTLSVYTHSQEVCFAYIDSGRDEDSIPGVSSVVGPLINILVHRLPSVSTEDSPATLAALAQRIQHQRGEATVHVACSIREVLEGDLGLKQQRPLFNTGVNFQRRPVSHETGRLAMVDDLEESRDPWHFDVLVRVTHTADNDSLKAALEFNGWQFSRGQMEDVLADFWTRIQNVTSKI
ncbi:non-ribosomal peptide synthetase module [Nemania sp. NC0429]|nr:non-ribosomal peptide synthetase module [Nemania sp. NC0429]